MPAARPCAARGGDPSLTGGEPKSSAPLVARAPLLRSRWASPWPARHCRRRPPRRSSSPTFPDSRRAPSRSVPSSMCSRRRSMPCWPRPASTRSTGTSPIRGQVVKVRGEAEAIQSGLGDIGMVVTALYLDRVPLYRMSYVTPFSTKDPDVQTAAVQAVQDANPIYLEHWKAIGITPVALSQAVDNYVIGSKTPLAKLADFKGKKVGGAGPNLPWLAPLGVAGVTSDLGAFYNSLATGVYEAALAWPQALGGFKLCEPAPHALYADIGVGSTLVLAINVGVLGKLPAEVKAAMAEVGPAYGRDSHNRPLARRRRPTRCARRISASNTPSCPTRSASPGPRACRPSASTGPRRPTPRACRERRSSAATWTRCAPPSSRSRATGTRSSSGA
ncbi:MAG: hypothetical protein FJX53_16720 [Alphaproteobacteria bacterium]|nr:hypothetical protein [Alphaproteobacteria bacterium]